MPLFGATIEGEVAEAFKCQLAVWKQLAFIMISVPSAVWWQAKGDRWNCFHNLFKYVVVFSSLFKKPQLGTLIRPFALRWRCLIWFVQCCCCFSHVYQPLMEMKSWSTDGRQEKRECKKCLRRAHSVEWVWILHLGSWHTQISNWNSQGWPNCGMALYLDREGHRLELWSGL